MIFGEQKTSTSNAKSNAEIDRFNAYLEESAVLQKLQIALKKRAGIDLQQLEILRAELNRMTENYQHQSHYVTELSRKVSVQPTASNSGQPIEPFVPREDLPTSTTASITAEELDKKMAEFHVVLKQIQKDTNQKIADLRKQQDDSQDQFEEEIDALSTAIGNISTAYDPRAALTDLDKKISSLELYMQDLQNELNDLKKKKVTTPLAQSMESFDDNQEKIQKENYNVVKNNSDKVNSLETKNTTSNPPELPPIEVIADENFTNHNGQMLFAAAPENEVFIANQMVEKFVPKVTPYAIKISQRHPEMAIYHLVTHPETVDYARLNRTEIIEAAMFVMGKGDLAKAERMTMKAGELELVDGVWEIVKRAVLRFE